ncbi:zinc ABC transporter substrate-binding protein [Carnobacteriaceae bacterium zg-ZUI252]|nr:zinc ABC transporter substrate-binding protein [Carnobacteriaceae bacterium zg-ZUI252]
MKKWLRMITSFLFVGVLFGCSAATTTSQKTESTNGKKTVYTTFYPVYDLTKRIVGDKMNVSLIIEGNQEAHDFELQPSQMAKIQSADLVVYNGANMETFIDDLKEKVKDESKFLDLSQGLTLLSSGDGVTNDKVSVNPHTWLSVKNAMTQLRTIYEKVAALDVDNKAYYEANLKTTLEQFKALDEMFEKELAHVPADKRYFVVSHAAFNYLAYDYQLKQVAVTGISPDEEPSAQQLKTIADFVKQHGITTIFFEGKATPKVAETLAKNTNTKTSTLYTMESLSKEEMDKGYLELMRHNLKALVESFNE